MTAVRHTPGPLDSRAVLERALARERAAHAETEARLRALLDAVNVGLWEWDVPSGEVYYSPEWKRQLGCQDEDVAPTLETWASRVHPDDRARLDAQMAEVFASDATRAESECRLRHADGSWRRVLAQSQIYRDAQGVPVRVVGSHVDVTELRHRDAEVEAERARRQATERALFALTARFVDATDETLDATIDAALETLGELRGADRCYLFRYDASDRTITNTHEWCAPGVEPQREAVQRLPVDRIPWWQAHISHGEPVNVPDVAALPPEAVSFRAVLEAQGVQGLVAVPMRVRGELVGFVGFDAVRAPRRFDAEDEGLLRILGDFVASATARTRSEAALRAHDRALAATVRHLEQAERLADLGSWSFDRSTQTFHWSPQNFVVFGFDPADGVPSYQTFLSRLDEESRARVVQATERLVADGVPFDVELSFVDADGRRRWVRNLGEPTGARGPQGFAGRGISHDVTAAREAEAARAHLQQQLLQAQKLESIGRLAGGVAHDFNNMLGVILGNVGMALDAAPRGSQLYEDLREIETAARRSEELTRTLLAFGRRQAFDPRPVALDQAVGDALSMLRRLIREDVRLRWGPAPDLWDVRVDPAQLDQILVNLAVNARDAIDGSGEIALEAMNVTLSAADLAAHPGVAPGEFVRLTVRDDGSGMDAATAAQVFEPFFTTKDVGAGTGLGLATVYGLVRQHGGFVTLDTAPGLGAAFHVHLPRAREEADGASPVQRERVPRGRGEAVLVVEDEAALLRLTARSLERLGYRVHACLGPLEATYRFDALGGEVELLLSDVVMPDMDGRRLADALRQARPDLRVLFMSGYAASLLPRPEAGGPPAPVLGKPFTVDELARAVRSALDGPVD